MKKIINYLLLITLILSTVLPVFAAENKSDAMKSSQKVVLDGKEVNLPAYLISNKNYIKLRDFAAILNATTNKFSLSYDANKKVVVIKNNESYTKVADDLKAIEKDKNKAILSTTEVIVNGKSQKIASAKIDGYNYLQIREVSKLVGVDIKYDEKTKTVELLTKKVAENVPLKCDNPSCGCKHNTMDEFNNCPCCGHKNNTSNDSAKSSSGHSCSCGKKMKDSNSSMMHESVNNDGDVYNCGCSCHHKTLEECKACPCCKGKDIYKNGKLFEKADGTKVEDTTSPKNTEKKEEAKVEPKVEPKEDIYNCGCGCHHKTLEDCKACPCCKGKDIYKNGNLFEKAA